MAVDMYFTARTGFNKNLEVTIDIKEVVIDYMDTRFFLDLISIFPVDY